jgi:hypothetical protein
MFDLLQLFGARRHVSRTSPQFLFPGSSVDRGYSSFEAFAFSAFLKVKFPEKIYLLRGNHEMRSVNQTYGLYNDCEIIYESPTMWSIINSAFDHHPIAAVIDRRIFCVHGGLCPVIRAAEQIHSFDRVREAAQDQSMISCGPTPMRCRTSRGSCRGLDVCGSRYSRIGSCESTKCGLMEQALISPITDASRAHTRL